MKKIIVLLSLILVGCGEPNTVKIDLALMPLYEQYKIDKEHYTGQANTKAISIDFSSLGGNITGMCHIDKKNHKTKLRIDIDPEYWFSSTLDKRTVILYHELGHCDLGLEHTLENSIMNATTMDGYLFASNRDLYLYKLFREGK